jgi:hypothetical protein
VILRANLPVAAVAMLVSNPFTYGPIGVAAYKVGSVLLGEEFDLEQAAALERSSGADTRTLMDRVEAISKPLFAGLALFAAAGGAIGFFGVHLFWRIAIRLRLRRRRRERPKRAPPR